MLALQRWAVAGPIVARIAKMLKREEAKEKKHNEENASFEEKFCKDVNSLYNAFNEFGNPFSEEQNQLVKISSRVVLDKPASESVLKAKQTDKDQFETFTKERLCGEVSSVYNIIRKNNLQLFCSRNSIVTSKSKKKILFVLIFARTNFRAFAQKNRFAREI